jgi:hypothetical protein
MVRINTVLMASQHFLSQIFTVFEISSRLSDKALTQSGKSDPWHPLLARLMYRTLASTWGFFEIGSCELFARVGLELKSS